MPLRFVWRRLSPPQKFADLPIEGCRVHRQQGDRLRQLQAFNREFAISLRDDNVTLQRFGFADHHQVAVECRPISRIESRYL